MDSFDTKMVGASQRAIKEEEDDEGQMKEEEEEEEEKGLGGEVEEEIPCSTIVLWDEDSATNDQVLLHREPLCHDTQCSLRFSQTEHLINYMTSSLPTHSRLASSPSPQEFDIFFDLEGLSSEIDPSGVGSLSSGFLSKARRDRRRFISFMKLEKYESILSSQIIETSTKTFYPAINEEVFHKVIAKWVSKHESRRGNKLQSALKQVVKFLNGSGDLQHALVSAIARETNIMGGVGAEGSHGADDRKLQELRGLHEMWELGLCVENHSSIPDNILKTVLGSLETAEKNSSLQEFAAGALQALVSSSTFMKQRIGDLDFLSLALESMRMNMGGLLQTPPPPAALFLLRAITHFSYELRGKSQTLSELPFFTSCLQTGASTDLVSAIMSLFLGVFDCQAFKVDGECSFANQKSPLDRIDGAQKQLLQSSMVMSMRRRSNVAMRTQTVTVGRTPIPLQGLLDFLKETLAQVSKPTKNFSVKLAGVLILSHLAHAAEKQSTQCVWCNGTLSSGSESSPQVVRNNLINNGDSTGTAAGKWRIDHERPPQLHSLREVFLTSHLVPTQIVHAVKLTLFIVGKRFETVVGGNGNYQNDVNLSMLFAGKRVMTSGKAKSFSMKKNQGVSTFLNLGSELSAVALRQQLFEKWEWLWKSVHEQENQATKRFEELLLEMLYHAAVSLFEWCSALHEQCFVDKSRTARYRGSAAMMNNANVALAGSVVSDKEVENVFQALAHILGFIQDGWLSRYSSAKSSSASKSMDAKKTATQDAIQDLESICVSSLEQLFRTPQCADKLVRQFGFAETLFHRASFRQSSMRFKLNANNNPMGRKGLKTARCDLSIVPSLSSSTSAMMLFQYSATSEPGPSRWVPVRARTTEDIPNATRSYQFPFPNAVQLPGKAWVRVPSKVLVRLTKCRSAKAEEMLARTIVNLLGSGTAGYLFVSNEVNITGFLGLLNFQTPRYRRTDQALQMICNGILLFSYGPVGMNADLDLADREAPLFNKAAEDPSKSNTCNPQDYALPQRYAVSMLQETASTIDLFAHKLYDNVRITKFGCYIDSGVSNRYAGPLATLGMAIWCMARDEGNCALLGKRTCILETHAFVVSNALSVIHATKLNHEMLQAMSKVHASVRGRRGKRHQPTTRLTNINFLFDSTGQRLELVRTAKGLSKVLKQQLDILESFSSAMWLILAQKRSKGKLYTDVLLHGLISKSFNVIKTLNRLLEEDETWRATPPVPATTSETLLETSTQTSSETTAPEKSTETKTRPSSKDSESRDSSTTQTKAVLNQVQRLVLQNLNLVWSAIDASDQIFLVLLKPVNQWMLKTLYFCCYSDYLASGIRRRSCVLLSYVARKADTVLQRSKATEHASGDETMTQALGEDAILGVSLDLLKENDDNLRSVACLLLSKRTLTAKHHAKIRSSGYIQRLLHLATEKSDYERRCALLALLNCAESGPSQEMIVKYGLYRLLINAWVAACTHSRRTIQHLSSALLSRVAQNDKNRTRIYQAELRAKEIAGWYFVKDDQVDSTSGGGNEFAKSSEAQSPKKAVPVSPLYNEEDARFSFLTWVHTLEEDLDSHPTGTTEDGASVDAQREDLRRAAALARQATPPVSSERKQSRLEVYNEPILAPEKSPLWQFRSFILPHELDHSELETMAKEQDVLPGSQIQVLQELERMRRGVEGDDNEEEVDNSTFAASHIVDGVIYAPNQLALHRRGTGTGTESDMFQEDEEGKQEGGKHEGEGGSDDETDTFSYTEEEYNQRLVELKQARLRAKEITFKVSTSAGAGQLHVPCPPTPASGTGRGGNVSPRKRAMLENSNGANNNSKVVQQAQPQQPEVTDHTHSEDITKHRRENHKEYLIKQDTDRHSKYTVLTSGQTKAAVADFGQRMRKPVRTLWEVEKSKVSPWQPRLSRATENSITVERDTFVFRSSESTLRETPEEFLDRQSRSRKRKKEMRGALRRKHLALFGRVPGSRVYGDLPVYEAPVGRQVYLYYRGDEDVVSSFLDEKELGHPEKPMSIFALGKVTVDPNALQKKPYEYSASSQEEWELLVEATNLRSGTVPVSVTKQLDLVKLLPVKLVMTALLPHASLCSKTVLCNEKGCGFSILPLMEPRITQVLPRAVLPPEHSQARNSENREGGGDTDAEDSTLAAVEEREKGQPETGVQWTRRGKILDDSLCIMLRVPARIQQLIDSFEAQQNPGQEKRKRKTSLCTTAFRGRRAFLNDNPVAKACVDYDWKLCCQKKAFRDFLSEFDQEDVEQTRQLWIQSAPMLISVFRFYCTLSPQNPFALLPKAFLRFLTDVRLLDGGRKFKEVCSNLFIKVASSCPTGDEVNFYIKQLNEKCDPLGLKRSRRLMRHEFLEILVLLAKTRYHVAGGTLKDAVSKLIKENMVRNLSPETVLDFDSWRIRRLYNRNVSNLFMQHDEMLRTWFEELAGSMPRSNRWGALEKRRMSIQEWMCGLRRLGLFTANFTQRECVFAFATSTTNIVDWVREWEPMISLTYQDFLEALGRVTELVVIPTKEELKFFGVENIVQFYTLMERTNLWSALDHSVTDAETRLTLWMSPEEQKAHAQLRRRQEKRMRESDSSDSNEETGVEEDKDDTEGDEEDSGGLRIDDRPLSEKLGAFLELLSARHGLDKLREEEIKFWDRRKKDARQRQSQQKVAPVPAPKSSRRTSADVFEEMDDFDPDSANMEDMEESINAVSDGLETFEISTATQLHEMWRNNRKRLADGRFEPRIKLINGVEYDIANLEFKDLPDYFKLENLLAAHCACESIRRCWTESRGENEEARKENFKKTLKSTEFLEQASEEQHIYWLKRNKHHAWVTEEQKGTYANLSEPEKQKDRDIVIAAIGVYLKQNM